MKLLYFSAPWCKACQEFYPMLSSVMEQYKDKIQFEKFDLEAQHQIAEKYHITGIPSMVITKNDILISARKNVMSKDELREWIAETLA